MRVFVAGAGGVIGRRLVPQLIASGHDVTGMARTPQRAAEIAALGARPIVCDALDANGLATAVATAAPEAIIHQLTSLPARIDPRRIDRDLAANDRLRTEGTANLVAAAQAASVPRIVAQSIAFAYAATATGRPHVEDDQLALDATGPWGRSVKAVADLERSVLGAGGIVLRYGYFYGPGSAFSRDGSMGVDARRRRLPLVGGGRGVWSFVHVDDAAAAAVLALAHHEPGVFNVADDEPAAVHDWLPVFANAVGAPRPWPAPAWLARLIAGEFGATRMTTGQGASNQRAREQLGFRPSWTTWRSGFAEL